MRLTVTHLNQCEKQQFELKNAPESDDNAETLTTMRQIHQTLPPGHFGPLWMCP
jgi:hypothetical protein